jgi:hypothetical protein
LTGKEAVVNAKVGKILIIFGAIFLAISIFFGVFWRMNAGAAERLGASLQPEARWVVRLVEKKAERQMVASLGLGLPALAMLGLGVAGIKRSTVAA